MDKQPEKSASTQFIERDIEGFLHGMQLLAENLHDKLGRANSIMEKGPDYLATHPKGAEDLSYWMREASSNYSDLTHNMREFEGAFLKERTPEEQAQDAMAGSGAAWAVFARLKTSLLNAAVANYDKAVCDAMVLRSLASRPQEDRLLYGYGRQDSSAKIRPWSGKPSTPSGGLG